MGWILNGVASFIAALIVMLLWSYRCKKKRWPSHKRDYVWAFVHGGVAYVMATLLIFHYITGMSFSELLQNGFGEIQVSIAFCSALFESGWTLVDMWNGRELLPPPGS